MTTPCEGPDPAFGYLHVVEDEAHGYTGGLLLVSVEGRPLEFHCTESVRPNRAQEILYGATLRSYVVGELIGGALVRRAQLPITLLLVTDEDEAEAGRRAGTPTTVVPLEGEAEAAACAGEGSSEALRRLAEWIDVAEPFERVRDAIREAQRLAAEGDAHDLAAAGRRRAGGVVGRP